MSARGLHGARPRLGISIVNYNSAEAVRDLLASLMSMGVEADVCVLDNSDELDVLESVGRDFDEGSLSVVVVSAERNLGYGRGNNDAVRRLLKVGAQTVWILNPDVTLLEWDHGLVQEQLTGNDEKIWATPTQENGQTTPGLRSLNTWTGRSHRLSHATAGARGRGVVYPSGHSIIMSARAWNRLGGFDDAYFLFFEESDLAIRAAEHRVAIGTLRGVKVHHDQGLSTGASPVARRKSQLAFEFATASGAIFFRKHFPRRLAAFVIVRVIFALYVGLRVNRGAMTAVLIGLRRGLAHCPGSGGAA